MVKQPKTKVPPQDEVNVQEFLDMIAPSIVKFNTDHLFVVTPTGAFGRLGNTRHSSYR